MGEDDLERVDFRTREQYRDSRDGIVSRIINIEEKNINNHDTKERRRKKQKEKPRERKKSWMHECVRIEEVAAEERKRSELYSFYHVSIDFNITRKHNVLSLYTLDFWTKKMTSTIMIGEGLVIGEEPTRKSHTFTHSTNRMTFSEVSKKLCRVEIARTTKWTKRVSIPEPRTNRFPTRFTMFFQLSPGIH